MNELIDNVIVWGEDKGIFAKSNSTKQFLKTVEEVGELADGLGKADKELVKDAIGDTVVTLILLAKMEGLTLQECLQSAYDVISKRTGKMENGMFVKDN